ncbi:MAG: T9SS type A sorting domain-containing protein [Dysgonamonadaceae bacterium]|jgi:hypothetical protein|nr:T9SS type A sorting domain-containing protein [Dysgonamonadaceae bacterium]
MKIFISIIMTFAISLNLYACNPDENASVVENPADSLTLSNLYVSIISNGRTAVFRLYDTKAAQQFYDQLPLNLELHNFRDAQWMFYPPEKLDVTVTEVYHDGKKGELSYYEPWGDVFMLYKDFYAGDEMHRLGIPINGVEQIEGMTGNARIEKKDESSNTNDMKLKITIGDKTVTATMLDNATVRDFISLLPLTLTLTDYAGTEKVSDLSKRLSTEGAPSGYDPSVGDITLYSPWGNLAIFYRDYGYASGLVPMGKIDGNGIEALQVSGSVTVTFEMFNATDIEHINVNKDLYQVSSNPAGDYLQVSGEFEQLTLMNMKGSTVAQSKENTIRISNLPTGVYLLKIDSKKNGAVIKKIVKQ